MTKKMQQYSNVTIKRIARGTEAPTTTNMQGEVTTSTYAIIEALVKALKHQQHPVMKEHEPKSHDHMKKH